MSICKGCGREIIWGITAEGKRIPLDPKAPCYAIIEGDGPKVERRTLCMVSHFATCPEANLFSGKNRKPAPPPIARPTDAPAMKNPEN